MVNVPALRCSTRSKLYLRSLLCTASAIRHTRAKCQQERFSQNRTLFFDSRCMWIMFWMMTFCCRVGYSIPMFTGFVIMFISTIS